MSGTSLDGVDVALTKITGKGQSTDAKLLFFKTFPFTESLRKKILGLAAAKIKEICEMNFILGEVFARCALKFLREFKIPPPKIDFIGSHGQTIYHMSGVAGRRNSTLQIGEEAVIAAQTGILTVGDFRPADIAAGGTGAPLVPYADFLLFRKKGRIRALLNLGGIANVTVVPPKLEEVMAFDTGPGNMVIDGLVRLKFGGSKRWDAKGQIAAQGKVQEDLLRDLRRHPFFSRKPPKSTGREDFGEAFVKNLLTSNRNMPFADLMATATFFTAASIYRSFRDFIFPRFTIDEIFISGGGVHNRTLFNFLARLFQPIPVRKLNELGVNGDAKEALAFALLADATIQGVASNVPGATGAKRPAILGKIICP